MNKKTIIILAVVMAATSIWFVFFQIKWINGVVQIQEKNFIDNINSALDEFVSNLEKQEIIQIITDQSFRIENDSSKIKLQRDPFNNNFISDSTVFYPVIQQDTIPQNGFSDTKTLDRPYENQTYFVYEIMNQLTQKRINTLERIDSIKIKTLLEQAFSKFNLSEKYKFAIVDEEGTYFYSSHSFNLDETNEVFRKQLYPNDLYSPKKIFLEIYFIEEEHILFKNLPKIAITSLLLTLIVTFLFAFTLYVIFKQKKISEMKNDFVNNMTHELKTPISTISLASQLLKDDTIPAEMKDLSSLARMISQETERLGFQVEKILQMAIIERGRVKFKFDDIEVHSVLKNIISSFDLKVKSLDGKLFSNLAATHDIVYVDKLHFSNIIYNLIDNALKYSDETVELTVSTKNKGDKVIIEFADKGIGIAKEHLKHIFEQFYRVPTGNLHNVKGFGLGLSYVKRIVDEFGGFIDVKSSPGKGTTFSISLPFTKE
ncbi:MAG: HAMP domain-containing histidine kinase [Bacteroidales bacterium]|nr:HAMP domain-containing histidine kinase [Bacteroidales bacterium]